MREIRMLRSTNNQRNQRLVREFLLRHCALPCAERHEALSGTRRSCGGVSRPRLASRPILSFSKCCFRGRRLHCCPPREKTLLGAVFGTFPVGAWPALLSGRLRVGRRPAGARPRARRGHWTFAPEDPGQTRRPNRHSPRARMLASRSGGVSAPADAVPSRAGDDQGSPEITRVYSTVVLGAVATPKRGTTVVGPLAARPI